MVEVATGPADSATREKVCQTLVAGGELLAWTGLQVLPPLPTAAHGPEGAQAERLATGRV